VKIAMVAKRVSHSHGGAERVAAGLSKTLANAGFEVHVFTMHSDIAPDRANFHIINVSNAVSPWRLFSFQRKVRNELRREEFDLVYGLCQVYPVDIYRLGDGIHQYWMELQYPNYFIRWFKYLTSSVHFVMRWLENQIIKEGQCRYFIANSMLLKDQLIDIFNIPDDRIRVIYNGVDHSIFNTDVKKHRENLRAHYSIKNNERVLLFVSNNWERKGLQTIIEAIRKSRRDNIKLIIVGRGKVERYLSIARQNNVSTDSLIFIGRTDHVEKYYGMADAFILPSRYEPFANVCLEAMACGLPVITTLSNGSSEVITHEQDGYILENWRDSDNLANLFHKLDNKKSLLETGSRAATTAKKYTWDKHIAETKQVFEQISAEKKMRN
jgi:UDP-glucose:(heptosyl)LPS alpha-1,3-glucosyltransferase